MFARGLSPTGSLSERVCHPDVPDRRAVTAMVQITMRESTDVRTSSQICPKRYNVTVSVILLILDRKLTESIKTYDMERVIPFEQLSEISDWCVDLPHLLAKVSEVDDILIDSNSLGSIERCRCKTQSYPPCALHSRSLACFDVTIVCGKTVSNLALMQRSMSRANLHSAVPSS